MALQSVTLDLPDALYERLQHAAATLDRPLEEVLFQSVQGNLPPSLDDLPANLHDELRSYQSLDNQALWSIARSELPDSAWQQHQQLLEDQQTRKLTENEQCDLMRLREAVDMFVLRRSYAMALLKWRGHSLAPLLEPHN
ncbi:MAG: hypothetical protein R3A44_36730 [Caldilineaceae bacterium]